MNRSGLLDLIDTRRQESSRALVVGVSGYCGSGKSTLAKFLAAAIPSGIRIRGDDFLDPDRSHHRSTDWDGVDRRCLVASVLDPHRAGQPSTFRRLDWSNRSLGPAEPRPEADVVVVDLIGLFHPEALPSIDVTVWRDVDLGVAVRLGMARDVELGCQHHALWRDVWVPNEIDFANRFAPRECASVLYSTD